MHASACACSAASMPGAGARVTRRMPSRCSFSTTGQHAIVAVAAAHGDDRQLALRTARTPSRISGTPPSSSHARVDVGRGAQHRLALAVVAAAPGLQHRGQAERRRPRRRASARSSTARNGAVAIAERAAASPSRRAGPATTSSARADGCTGAIGAERARGAGGHAFPLVRDDVARRRRPARAATRSSSPPTTRSPTSRPRAPRRRVEERERARRAGCPASPSIQPELPAAEHRHLRHGRRR